LSLESGFACGDGVEYSKWRVKQRSPQDQSEAKGRFMRVAPHWIIVNILIGPKLNKGRSNMRSRPESGLKPGDGTEYKKRNLKQRPQQQSEATERIVSLALHQISFNFLHQILIE
jgi:hypothetical protein